MFYVYAKTWIKRMTCKPFNDSLKPGHPKALSCDEATREAKVSPDKVTMGVPAHSTSMPVVWPLHSGVSRQTSASWPRLVWVLLLRSLTNLGNDFVLPHMLLFGCNVWEDDCIATDTHLLGSNHDVCLPNLRKPQQPKHSIGNSI